MCIYKYTDLFEYEELKIWFRTVQHQFYSVYYIKHGLLKTKEKHS